MIILRFIKWIISLDELSKMSFALTNKETKEEYGNLTIDLNNPQTKYEL